MVTGLRRGLVAAIFAFGAALLLYSAANVPSSTRAASDTCQLTWSHVTPPQVGSQDRLNDVHALAADDVWAVGDFDSTSTLTEHWNGTDWNVVSSPNAPTGASALKGIDGIAPDDVWAVGINVLDANNTKALILHWNGAAWNIVPAPALAARHRLTKVAALASNDAWAVGSMNENGVEKNLALHWDGAAWQVVNTPNPDAAYNTLDNVVAISANDVWAVGTRVLHWDGTQWSISYTDPSGRFFKGLAAFASNDVWASGEKFLRWDGAQWNIVEPGDSRYIGIFKALAGNASDDIYAVGDAYAHGSLGVSQYYDGAQWNELVTPASGRNTYLNGVSVVSAAEVWAVGWFNSYLPPPVQRSVILHGIPQCPLNAPVLLTPSNQSTVTVLRPLLDWRNVKNATSYRVQLREAFGLWKQNASVTVSEYKTPQLARGKIYVWRVRACDAAHCGAWSNYFAFTVK